MTVALAVLLFTATTIVAAVASPPEDADEPGEPGYRTPDIRAHFIAHLLDSYLTTAGGDIPDQFDGQMCFDDLYDPASGFVDLNDDDVIDAADERLARGICWLADLGIVKGLTDDPDTTDDESGTFGWGDHIHRDQAASFTARAYVVATTAATNPTFDELASVFYYDVSDRNVHSGAIHYLTDLDNDDEFDDPISGQLMLQGREGPLKNGLRPFVPNPGASTAVYDAAAGLLWVGHTHLVTQRWEQSVDDPDGDSDTPEPALDDVTVDGVLVCESLGGPDGDGTYPPPQDGEAFSLSSYDNTADGPIYAGNADDVIDCNDWVFLDGAYPGNNLGGTLHIEQVRAHLDEQPALADYVSLPEVTCDDFAADADAERFYNVFAARSTPTTEQGQELFEQPVTVDPFELDDDGDGAACDGGGVDVTKAIGAMTSS